MSIAMRAFMGYAIRLCVMTGVTHGWVAADASTMRALTVRDAIETTRAMADRNGNAVFVSPNEKRYAIMLITGDVDRDGVWAEIRVGRLDSLEGARPEVITRLFTRGLGGGFRRQGGSELLTRSRQNAPRWLDDERIAFLWEDGETTRQVVAVSVTGQLTQLTHHSSDVIHFNVHPTGVIVYGARIACEPQPPDAARRDGFAVEATDAFELLQGCGAWERQQHALYILKPGESQPQQVAFAGGDSISQSAPAFPYAILSEQGDRALYPSTVSHVPSAWRAYTDSHFGAMLKSLADLDGGPYAAQFRKLFVVDVQRATARPLWDVPQEPHMRMRAAWSADGSAVVLGPTFLPPASVDDAGRAGEALAEVNVASGAVRRLPVERDVRLQVEALRWCAEDCIEAATVGGEILRFRETQGEWRRVTEAGASERKADSAPIRVELRQGLNEPPAFHAIEANSGRARLLLDLNPGLTRRFALGRVEWLDHTTAAGHRWTGRLYYPARYKAGRQYPLVVQTHSFAPKEEFSLYGRGAWSSATGPGISVYLAQLLAGRGMFVLHGRVSNLPKDASYLRQTQIQSEGTEALIEELVLAGKVERQRVGIMGYSATGWDVSYALTHSSFPYAAAITDDNKDGSYLQAALSDWVYGATAEMIGMPPFAEGLKAWLEHSPAFNAHRVQTPLLLTITGPGRELSAWEMFSRLRYLRKPVEYFVIPDVEQGSHGLQNPRQIVALQERALDWWCFWLKGEEDPQASKRAQYVSWRKLRALHEQGASPERAREPEGVSNAQRPQ